MFEKKQHTKNTPDFLSFDFVGHTGTPGMCLGCFLMVFSDSWGRKNLFLPPTQKIFIFWQFYGILGEARGASIFGPKIQTSAYALESRFSTPGMGLNHFLMRFSESRDDFRWNMHFFKIFSTFMVFEGEIGENPWNDPKITPKNDIFP